MCEYCGCREVPAIGELRDEHHQLLDEVDHVRRALAAGDRAGAASLLETLVAHLERHVGREENGIFAALRRQGDYADEIDDLEGEHRWFDTTVAELDPTSAEFERVLDGLFVALGDHIEREDLGIFPVSVVTLGAEGWDIVHQAHADQPSFLEGTHAPAPS